MVRAAQPQIARGSRVLPDHYRSAEWYFHSYDKLVNKQGALSKKHPCCQNPLPVQNQNQVQVNVQVFQTRVALKVNHSKPTNRTPVYLSPKIWFFYIFELLRLRQSTLDGNLIGVLVFTSLFTVDTHNVCTYVTACLINTAAVLQGWLH